MGCYANRASKHRRFRHAVMDTQPRVLAADAAGDTETELTLAGTDPIEGAPLEAVTLYGLGIAQVQPNGDALKVIVR